MQRHDVAHLSGLSVRVSSVGSRVDLLEPHWPEVTELHPLDMHAGVCLLVCLFVFLALRRCVGAARLWHRLAMPLSVLIFPLLFISNSGF